MYVAVKGGEAAIAAAHRLLADQGRGDPAIAELTLDQIAAQLGLAVDRVMSEGALYDRELAACAVRQAQGDLVEAAFLLRAYRTTLPRLAVTLPIDTAQMTLERRISATHKDVPGGQVLGATFDYTHRLLDISPRTGDASTPKMREAESDAQPTPRITDILGHEGLIEPEPANDECTVADLSREPLSFPTARDMRLQNLARGDEGFLTALGYATQRGYGRNHPFVAEIRAGAVSLEIVPEELGFAIEIGEIAVTECQMVNQFKGSASAPPQFTRGYGLAFGRNERKAMAMALVDRALRARELGEDATAPPQDEEFVLYHSDNVEAQGFLQHLKLPHYVDFQSELELVRRLRATDGPDAEAAE